MMYMQTIFSNFAEQKRKINGKKNEVQMNQGTKTTTIQLIKYGIVGVSNSLITLIVIWLCNEVLDMKLMLADTIGYIAGLINSFIWNKQWVFKSHNHRIYYEIVTFAVGFLICFGLQFVTVIIFRNPMKSLDISMLGISSATVGEYLAVGIGMVVYTLANYIYNRSITFKKR